MFTGQLVFSQLMDFLPRHDFNRCVRRYRGNYRTRHFSCFDRFLAMAFAQLAGRESLRDIETCLGALQPKLYHAGFRGSVSRSTLADANERRDWRIYADFAQTLIATARRLYAGEDFGVALDETAYVFDSTTIDLCLSLFPRAHFRRHKAAIKLHTLMDLRGSIPCFVRLSSGKTHDVKVLDELAVEPGAFVILDRAYVHFAPLYSLAQRLVYFVLRAKKSLACRRTSSRPVDKSTGLRSDATVRLVSRVPSRGYPAPLRCIRYVDLQTHKRFIFLTNHFGLPALTVAELYRCRWQIEVFFKWIKQHLRIKAFFGTSENAVKTQVWIAISVYVLVAILKKELKVDRPLSEILQILSLTLFEKMPLTQAFTTIPPPPENADRRNLLLPFNF